MTVTSHESLFGRLAVQFGLVTMEQLSQATQLQAAQAGALRLGDIFIEQGWLSPTEVEALRSAQQSMRADEPEPQPVTPSSTAASPPAAGPTPSSPAGSVGSGLPGIPQETAPPASLDPLASEAAAIPRMPASEPAPVAPAGRRPVSGPTEGSAQAPPIAPTSPASAVPERPRQPAPAPTRSSGVVDEFRVAPPSAPRPVSRELGQLLGEALRVRASDLHLHAGCPARLRIHGELVPVSDQPLDGAQTQALVEPLLEPALAERLHDRGQVDFAYEAQVPGHTSPLRMRCNVYRQRLGLDLVARLIPGAVPTLADLGLPSELARLTNFPQGMVLITGPMGCGKTSTLAALLDLINEERNEHIVTAEDPIEYVFQPKRCVVNQREVGSHSHSYSRILRAALREDPDVIAMAELRDPESVELALSAAETGHLVLGTLHTASAIGTVHRILSSFPPSRQEQARTQFAESLRAVVSQRLLRRADGQGRVPALEILMVTQAITNLIRENRLQQIPSQMQTGSSAGMVTLEFSVTQLLRSGVIDAQEAALYGVGSATSRPSGASM